MASKSNSQSCVMKFSRAGSICSFLRLPYLSASRNFGARSSITAAASVGLRDAFGCSTSFKMAMSFSLRFESGLGRLPLMDSS